MIVGDQVLGFNLAQVFMGIQILTCVGGAIGFLSIGKPWNASVWFFYGLANIGWFQVASGEL